MKKIVYLILAGCSLFLGNAYANPGDTTWVQSHTDVQLTSYGSFDAPVTFPAGTTTYRRIFMIFELGKYACPGNPTYCYDWDYDISTLLMPASGDTLELGRLITPYADYPARMPLSWKGKYVYDVTDFYPVLKNNAMIRVNFYGYSYGFTATVKFTFIEGVPERNIAGIQKVWGGSYDYGHGATPINTALGNVSLTAPAGTVSAESRFLITGHGGDASANAAEFYQNSYTMNLNNNPLVTQSIWRNNCGFNNYYPQNGTWVFDRASWCPGDLVHPYTHILTGITANSNYTLNATFPPYTSIPSSSGSQALYKIQNLIFYYGALNKTTDASLEDIIAPTDNEAHFRENPFVGKPKILVRNSGSTIINSIRFEYGVEGQSLQQYTWNGTINSLENTEIALAECTGLNALTDTNKFVVSILDVNGQADADATNDHLVSYFVAAPVWNASLKIEMHTNAQVAGGISENNWKIYDVDDNIVAQRSNNTPNTTYTDLVYLAGGAYRLVVEDAGCDGMNWWLFSNYPSNPGVASIKVYNMSSPSFIPLKMNGYFNGDFGCGFTQYFYADPATSSGDLSIAEHTMGIYPNPANDNVTISINGAGNSPGRIKITDAVGKVIYNEKTIQAVNTIRTDKFPNGFYMVSWEHETSGRILQSKLVILK